MRDERTPRDLYPDVIAGKAFGVEIPTGRVRLRGDLNVPADPRAIVLFAHGSGSSRHSPRNRYVAHVLNQARLATLLFDLLTPEEESFDIETAALRFNIGLLVERLVQASNWVAQQAETKKLSVGYFGASTGAAAALIAAAEAPVPVGAVVSRGGRPDLAGSALSSVQAPTLLIVGEQDIPVIQLNRDALDRLHCKKRLEIVPGATHLFEEPGTLEQVARLAREWFELHCESRPANRAA